MHCAHGRPDMLAHRDKLSSLDASVQLQEDQHRVASAPLATSSSANAEALEGTATKPPDNLSKLFLLLCFRSLQHNLLTQVDQDYLSGGRRRLLPRLIVTDLTSATRFSA